MGAQDKPSKIEYMLMYLLRKYNNFGPFNMESAILGEWYFKIKEGRLYYIEEDDDIMAFKYWDKVCQNQIYEWIKKELNE